MNPHTLAGTRSLAGRVCQFRHSDVTRLLRSGRQSSGNSRAPRIRTGLAQPGASFAKSIYMPNQLGFLQTDNVLEDTIRGEWRQQLQKPCEFPAKATPREKLLVPFAYHKGNH